MLSAAGQRNNAGQGPNQLNLKVDPKTKKSRGGEASDRRIQNQQKAANPLTSNDKENTEKDVDPPKKAVNYKKKADTKVNQGRTTLMDARLWTRRVDDDLNQTDPNLRKQCLD